MWCQRQCTVHVTGIISAKEGLRELESAKSHGITLSFFSTAHIFQIHRSKQTLLAPWCAILPIKHSYWWGLQCLGDASSDSQSCAFALWHQDAADSAESSGYKSSSKTPGERGDSFQAEISSGYESRRKKQQKKKKTQVTAGCTNTSNFMYSPNSKGASWKLRDGAKQNINKPEGRGLACFENVSCGLIKYEHENISFFPHTETTSLLLPIVTFYPCNICLPLNRGRPLTCGGRWILKKHCLLSSLSLKSKDPSG